MTDSEMIHMVIRDRQIHSLETISITRGPDGQYTISSYRGVSVCDKRESMQEIVDDVLDVQDSYFRDESGL